MQKFDVGFQAIWMSIMVMGSFSMLALLMLNIERILALTFPFFHQTAVTKGKLIAFFLPLQVITTGTPISLQFLYPKAIIYFPIVVTVFLLLLLFILAFLNYQMLVVVKSKREDELRVAPSSLATTPGRQGRQKKRKRNFKSVFTSSSAVACFLVCCFPGIVYSIWSYISKPPTNDRQDILFHIWVKSFVCMNPTFNCLIFFWRNSILRREGMKTVKCSPTKLS